MPCLVALSNKTLEISEKRESAFSRTIIIAGISFGISYGRESIVKFIDVWGLVFYFFENKI